ncbi:uncharacterized protein LOC131233892 [Magnolia sinica]|uniref:uncharacterized protein LOC131233892 n=1 Tax=Magnolia sinica TaxID=86752 RepID=UPI002658EF6E|nr:uncharacterized protein LOC131233892 [Magnolia sinica]
MDYNDNDFQSQNFQLGGEDNSKFPPGLRSYVLPKFDLDEHLQVDLRFDSLAEAEVLLGIRSQEENHWIEDFSQGSSGIEFSSGTAESRSISMRNNVWSEATSTESVEMLLKSVGQDEMITEQTIIEESDASDVLDGLNNQMDPNLNRDASLPSKTGDITDADPTLPPDKALQSSLALSEEPAVDLPHIVYIPQTHQNEKSGFENLIDLDSSSIGKDSCVTIAANQCSLDTNLTSASVGTVALHSHTSAACGVANACPGNTTFESMEVDTSVGKSAHHSHASATCGVINACSDNTAFESMEADPSATSIGNPVIDSEELNNQKLPQQATVDRSEVACCEKPEGLIKDDAQERESQFLSKGIRIGDQHSEGQAVESCTGNVLKPSSPMLSTDSSLQIPERCNEVVFSEKEDYLLKADTRELGIGVFSKDDEADDHCIGSTQETSFLVTGEEHNLKGELAESSKKDAGNLTSSVVKVSSPIDIVQETKEMVEVDDGHDISGAHAAEFASRDVEFVATGKKMVDKVTESDIRNPAVTSNVSGNAIPEKVHCTHDLLDINNTELHISPSLHAKSSSLLGVVCGGAHIVHSDDPIAEKETERSSTNSRNIEVEIGDSPIKEKRVDALAYGHSDGIVTDELHGSPAEHNISDKSVSNGDVSGGVSELTSFTKLEKANLVKDEVVEQKEVGKLSLPVSNFIDLDKEETVIGISMKPSSSILEENSNSLSPSGLIPHSESCRHKIYNRSEEPLSELVVQPSASVEKPVDDACQNEPQASIAVTITPECSQDLEPQPTFPASVKDGSGASGAASKTCETTELHVIGKMGSSGEGCPQPLLPLSADESFHDIGPNNQQDCEANYATGGDNGGKNILLASREGNVPDCFEESLSEPVTSSVKIASHALEAASGSPNTAEPNCGSPTVITCSKPLHSEKEPQEGGDQCSLPQNVTVSEDRPWTSSSIDRQDVKSTAHDPKEKDSSEDDKSFTFEVSSLKDLSERETGKGWKPFANIQAFELPQSGEGSPVTPKVSPKIPLGSPQVSDAQKVRASTKGTGKDKTRTASGSATERGSSKHRKPAKEASYQKQTIERDGKSCGASAKPVGTTGGTMQGEAMRQYAYIEGSGTKTSGVQTVQTSGLPDLNSSASPVRLFHQPFTDPQQVQLRAQIFVYGSLIQCTAPDEACMISAFGDTSRDGGKSMWESVWRLAVERLKNQRSPLSNSDTPMHSRSGIRVPEQAPRGSPLQNKAHSSPAGQTGSKGAPSSVASSMFSFSSPVWSLSTPSRDGLQSGNMPRGPFLDSHQSLSPLHPYRSPHPQQYVGNSTPWLPHSSSPAPWFVTPQTPELDAAVQYSALPVVEAVQVTSVRDSSASRASNTQPVPPSPLAPAEVPASVPASTAVLMEAKKISASLVKHPSADQKFRKRKKSSASEEPGGQISLITQSQTQPTTGVTKQLTTSVGISSPANPVSRVVDDGVLSNSSPMASTQNRMVGGSDTEKRVVITEETYSRIEQAKLHAEDAAAMAASAVRHSQGIWSQLSVQKNSGLVSEVEAKLASAAVAAAAAASVAKAAAAAAKVASEAALQAQLMAEEAMALPKMGSSGQHSETSLPDGGANLRRITPALILKGKDKTNSSSSVIVAAREAARKRVEAAAAATKRAENLDAVVKAAELAAEAVSQAGAIIAMGDPIPLSLSELIEAGPEGNWKVQQVPAEQTVKANGTHGGEQSSMDGANGQPSNSEETQGTAKEGNMPALKELSRQPVENIPMLKELSKDAVANEKGQEVRKGRKTSDLANTIGVSAETEVALRVASVTSQINEYEKHQQAGTEKENSIREGSHVEVASDEVGLRGAWFSAKVLSLEDGNAHVRYGELLQDEVRAQLKEWIPLEGEGNKAPKIRIAHPMTAAKFEGTRKRRRAAVGNYVWSVGDRVDALMRDSWREGIVTEKGKEDETKLTIHFPAEGDASIVRSWNLRPSLVWKDGHWIEWSRENNGQQRERDTPKEKRPKLGRHEVVVDSQVDASGKDKLSKNPCIEDSRKAEESRPLMLSVKDTVFSVGKSTGDTKNSDALKMKRTGLQKEGSRVVFGVPKPGKKRKFMEVSKHLVSDRATKITEGTDSIKFAKYLMPQGSRGWKNASKVDFKGKQAADSKPKVLKSRKTQSIQSRTKSEKNGSLISSVSVSSDGTGRDPLMNAKASSMSHDENSSLSDTPKAADDPLVSPSLELGSDVPSSKKKPSASKPEQVLKRKLVPAAENMARNEEKGPSLNENSGRSISDVVEPRRSNRRIQPTSRLLEGLQSSLIITKIPSVSHDKGTKGQSRSTPSSRGNSHGRE